MRFLRNCIRQRSRSGRPHLISLNRAAISTALAFTSLMQETIHQSQYQSLRFNKLLNMPPKTRSLMNLAMIGALGKMTEWEGHCKGAINNGCSVEEIRAAIHVVGIYCGAPQALECFRSARKVLETEGLL